MSAQQQMALDVPRGPSKGVQLRAFKKAHGILTHCAPFRVRDAAKWLAVIPMEADTASEPHRGDNQ